MTVLRNALLLCLTWSLLGAPETRADTALTLSADIGPRPVAEALAVFSRQTGLQLIYVSTIAETQQSKGARAGVTAAEALTQLLDGTGLQFEFLNARTVRIYPAPPVVPTALASVPAPHPYPERRTGSSAIGPEEIVVTATRREELANRVPISMVVWTQEAMEASGVKNIADIGAMTPSVEYDYFAGFGAGVQTNIAIRGVSARNGTTTGIFLDDTPIPAPGDWGSRFGRAFPITFDLERVEVLRGPQGTLFGRGAMGGAVRFIANQPSSTEFSGQVHSEIATTGGGAMTYEAGVAAGGPVVADRIGFRLSAWYQDQGGYVDRVNPDSLATIDQNANRSLSKTVRGALTLVATPHVQITPSLTYQSTAVHDSSTFNTSGSDPGAGILRNNKLQQPSDDSYYLASLKLTAGLRMGELTAVTSYFHRKATAVVDAWSYNYGGWGNPLGGFAEFFGFGLRSALFSLDLNQTASSAEVRLTSSDPDSSLNWVAGAFFSNAQNSEADRPSVVIMHGLHPDGYSDVRESEEQLAVFGHAALRITERVTASTGLRIGYAQSDAVLSAPLFPDSSLPTLFGNRHSEVSVTPNFGLEYQTHTYNVFYATVAKGYRPGTASWPFGYCDVTVHKSYDADSIWSYEVGAKHSPVSGRVQFSSSLFYVRWDKQQDVHLQDVECKYIGNLANAASYGFDAAAQALVTDRLKVGLSTAYTDVHYTETVRDSDTTIVSKGDAIGAPPVVPPPWNLKASINYSFPLARGITASVEAEDHFHSRVVRPYYSGGQLSYIPGFRPQVYPRDPSTNFLNLRASVRWSQFDLTVHVDNALDSQPSVLRTNAHFLGSLVYATTFRPRTVALSGTWRFD